MALNQCWTSAPMSHIHTYVALRSVPRYPVRCRFISASVGRCCRLVSLVISHYSRFRVFMCCVATILRRWFHSTFRWIDLDSYIQKLFYDKVLNVQTYAVLDVTLVINIVSQSFINDLASEVLNSISLDDICILR